MLGDARRHPSRDEDANPRLEPARSVSTLSASRVCSDKPETATEATATALSEHPLNLPGFFHPDNALELPPSGP